MTQDSMWISYGGTARIVLALVLLGVAAAVAYAGTRLSRPVRLPKPGRALTAGLLIAWVLAIGTLLGVLAAAAQREQHDHIARSQPANPVTLVTLMAALILFLIVFAATPQGLWVRLTSGVIAAMAAPMIFELPFDLIIAARVTPPAPPGLAVYRVLVFVMLGLVELTTLSLLTLSPMVRVFRPAFCCLSLMLLVFGIWGLGGFGYPATPFSIAMNDVSKILAFVTALSLFFPEWFTPWRRHQPDSDNRASSSAIASAASRSSGSRSTR
jgi:uncharacterized membrane protein YidH (DUF202 family)